MSNSQTKKKISDPRDWPNFPNGILLSHWHLSLQSCKTTRFQTSGYVTIHSENFSLVGYNKTDSIRKGRMLVLVKGQSPTLFPLINFPFLAWLPGSLSFSLNSLYNDFPVPLDLWPLSKVPYKWSFPSQGQLSKLEPKLSSQWCSLKSSHPPLLPQSPKVCSLYLSLLLSHI